ncbi:hypothetical protein DQQ10_02815 [Pseudochryseolinea flava]|uniref:Uncharacterized protein n=2 Tax=Pseudochryseolinea flava TaxID=2059302 RepID=A0A364Y7F6_9BACT|nr:hypothetical protein DQQ10_02815 [Pseudochryseolinea flava]
MLLVFPAMAQNTKGDRPQGSGGQKRESRFKLPFKKKKSATKTPNYNRAQSKGASRAGSARRSSKPGKTKVYPQPARTVTNPGDRQRAWKGNASGNRVTVRSNSGKNKNVYPQYGRYVRVKSKSAPKNTQRAVSNRAALSRLNKLQGPEPSPPKKKRKVVPRSASRSFIRNRSINVYANFPRSKKRPERAVTTDIAGRKLRTKNFETPRPAIVSSGGRATRPRRVSDKPYRGPNPNGPKFKRPAPRTQENAWTGDITGRKIRHRNKSSKPDAQVGDPVFPRRRIHDRYGDRPYRGPGGGYRSASQPGEKRVGLRPNPGRAPGIGANGIGGFRGRIKAQRPFKGGGSVSGGSWNNRRTPIAVRPPGANGQKVGGFPGKLKRFGADPGFNDQGEGFSGSKKTRKPLKGGGSVSGRVWNNKGNAIPARTPRGADAAKIGYSGNIKAGKPVKGGGSVSGQLWNNKEKALNPRTPRGARAGEVAGFPGKLKRYQADPGFNDQGEEFTGYIRRPRFWKDYIKNEKAADGSLKKKRPSSSDFKTGELQVVVRQRKYVKNKSLPETATPKQSPTRSTYEADELQVKMRQRKYVKNKNSAEESLLKKAPTRGTYQTGELQVKVKQRAYGQKEHGAEGSLPGIKPTKTSVKASEFSRSIRRDWDYIKNPSSADQALKVREPGKAFARSTDYQGNIKMKKFELFEKNKRLHPDSKFVKINKNNVDSERDAMTNFKLWWSRLFKKNETAPEHLKEKGKKPRYDKGEDGLWYD